jgi:hypothetical protein
VAADVAADEAADLTAGVGDREDEAVAVGVDEPAASRPRRQIHADELVVVHACRAQMHG